MKKEKILDVVFILDKSGSMSNNIDNTITSFNEYLEREKNNKYKTRITTTLFSDNYSYLHKCLDIKTIKPITINEYNCSGCTALYDAVGNTINYIDSIKHDKVLFIIITDGYENASKEYNKDIISEMIKKHNNYQFIYIGADIDSYKEASSIGIKKDNIANFKKDKESSSLLFKSVECFASSMMEDKNTCNWKNELDNYITKNKE